MKGRTYKVHMIEHEPETKWASGRTSCGISVTSNWVTHAVDEVTCRRCIQIVEGKK